MNTKFIVGGFAGLLLLSLIGVFAMVVINSEEVITEDATTVSQSLPANPEGDPASTSAPADGETAPTNVESIVLRAKEGFTGEGTATRSTGANGEYILEIIANLPPPAEGKFYEGWVVGSSVLSTGKLTQESEDGAWSAVFTDDSDEDLYTYNEIVITEETEADGLDGKPEVHVLEGSFPSE